MYDVEVKCTEEWQSRMALCRQMMFV